VNTRPWIIDLLARRFSELVTARAAIGVSETVELSKSLVPAAERARQCLDRGTPHAGLTPPRYSSNNYSCSQNRSLDATIPISNCDGQPCNPAVLGVFSTNALALVSSIQLAPRLHSLTIGNISNKADFRCHAELSLPHLEQLTFYARYDHYIFATVVASCRTTLRCLTTHMELMSVIDALEEYGGSNIRTLLVIRNLPVRISGPALLARLVAACSRVRHLALVALPRITDLEPVLNALQHPLKSFGYVHLISLTKYESMIGQIIDHPMLLRLRSFAARCVPYEGPGTVWNSEGMAVARAKCSLRGTVTTNFEGWAWETWVNRRMPLY